MFNYSVVKPAHAHAHAHTNTATNVRLLNFSKPAPVAASSPSAPAHKSWFTKKFIPAVRQVGSIAGKVATVASVL
jgi:hypothetical protein